MRSLLFHSPDSVELVESAIPVPGPREALLRIEASAICGSELHAKDGSNPGHEAAGVIESAADGSGYRPGERVGISAVTGCGTCRFCSRGEQIFCAQVRVQEGMHADYVAAPVSALRRLPDGITPGEAVLLTGDAFGVPIRALRKVPHRVGGRVVVLGLGPVGLAHVLVRANNGAEVIAIEPSAYRRELAVRLGAAVAVAPGEDIGEAPAMVIECTGIAACVQQSLDMVEPGGTVVQSGWCTAVEIDPARTMLRREVNYTGTWYYTDDDYPSMVASYEGGLPVSAMTTHEFPADRIAEAYRQFVSKETGKIILHWT
jgi:2-desacetyl-2-hydroxyethyl bacteriochlorophyllide A dehydrogenase